MTQAPISIQSALIRGGWQLTPGHLVNGQVANGLAPILDAVSHGFRVFDCADIYTGVEDLLGQARAWAHDRNTAIRVHTKFVPDRDRLKDIGYQETARIIERSLTRLRTDRLDLVQFHWWDNGVPRHLEVLDHLFRLKAAGKIAAIGLTNFDTEQLQEIVDEGFEIASIQVQYSLVDRRSEARMIPLCQAHGIKVYGYGALLGGFLSEQWLDRPEPALAELPNRSLVKYKLIIDDWGGWARFQSLLRQLRVVAHGHDASLAQVAVAATLSARQADALIVGLSASRYEAQNAELARLVPLSPDELRALRAWDCPLEGDVYHLERHTARHAGIMKYNLNRQADAAAVAG